MARAVATLSSANRFAVSTYIAPILRNVTQISSRGVTPVLLLFGVGLTLGNVIGGRLGGWKLMPSIIGIFTLPIPVLGLFAFTSAAPLPAEATVFAWGVLAFALVSPLQMRVLHEAARAPNLVSILNQGAFNLGNAAGAWIASIALTAGLAYGVLP